jgi:hypothetical protein
MIKRLTLPLSLLLNLALLGAWAWRALVLAPAPPPGAAVSTPILPPTFAQTVETPHATVVTNFVKVGFRWPETPAPDLAAYRDALHDTGCPESTLREILTGEANARYADRRRALIAPWQARYWDLLADARERTTLTEALDQLDEDREALLEELLGESGKTVARDHRDLQAGLRGQTGFLPMEKQDQLLALDERYRALRDAAAKEPHPGGAAAARKARARRLDELGQQRRAEERALLTPAEFEEWRLRATGASRWAANLHGFEPTAQELRAVALARLALIEPQDQNAPVGKPQTKAHSGQLKDLELDGLREIFGPERYAEYRRATQPEFQRLLRMTDRFQLPPSVAGETWGLRETALAQAAGVRQNLALNDDQRAASLAAIQLESIRALRRTLGERAFGTYQKYLGDWMRELGQLDPAAPQDR